MDAAPREGWKWITPARAAAKFGVTAHSLRSWANDGKVTSIRTLGGHRRYDEDEVSALAAEMLAEVAS